MNNKITFSKLSYNYMTINKRDINTAAKEFEALMIKQILKEAYRPIIKNKGFYQRMYYDMFLESMSNKLAEAGGIGVAKFIIESYKNNAQNEDREGLKTLVENIIKERGLPEWVSKIVEVESNYDPKAVSPKGASGLWQLMPETARSLGLEVSDKVDERLDPVKSTVAATQLIKRLYDKYKSWVLVLAAYNWGEGNVDRVGVENILKNMELLPRETRDYIKKLIGMLKLAQGR